MQDAWQAWQHFNNHKNQDQTFAVGDIVMLSTKNLKLLGIQKFQLYFIASFIVISTGPAFYCLDLIPSMAAVYQ